MLMIMDLQGWGRIRNHFSPGSAAFFCVHSLSQRKVKKKEN